MILKEMIEPDTFLYFLDKETMNWWKTDMTKKKLVFTRKESNEGLGIR